MTKTKKAPEFELVNVDMETGEEELLGTGTWAHLSETMANHAEEADENIALTGDLSYYPTMRIQPFQGW